MSTCGAEPFFYVFPRFIFFQEAYMKFGISIADKVPAAFILAVPVSLYSQIKKLSEIINFTSF